MFKLDNDFLVSLGLGGLPVDEKNKLLQTIYERLEMNVGMRLAEKMTDQQLNEFEGFIDRNDETGALRWLETNFPNYKQVVAEELEKLKAEVQAAAPQIIAASQQNPAASQMQPGQHNFAAPQGNQPVYQSTAPAQPTFAPHGSAPVSAAPGQPAVVQPNQYNPENPFRSQNPEFKLVGQSMQQGGFGAPSIGQAVNPAPAAPTSAPMPTQPPVAPSMSPPMPAPQPWNAPFPSQQPPAGPGTSFGQQSSEQGSQPFPPVDFPPQQ